MNHRLAVSSQVFALAITILAAGRVASAASDVSVFAGPEGKLTQPIREGVPTAGGPLRILTVQERVGLARKNDLVRVPLFFHPGECAEPNALAIYDVSDTDRKSPIAYQADDIRMAGGQVAQMHVYFYADLAPWQRRQFAVNAGKNPQAGAITVQEKGDQVTFTGDDITASFQTQGPRAGVVTGLQTPFASVNLVDGWLGPNLRLTRQDVKCAKVRTTEITYANPDGIEVRDLKYAAGPLFAKLRVTIRPKGVPDDAEITYIVPKHGSMLVVTHRTFPEDPEQGDTISSEWPVVLWGKATFGKGQTAPAVVNVPTGLRRLVRYVQNHNVQAAVAEKEGFSIVNVPHVSENGGGVYYQAEDPAAATQPAKKEPPPKQTLQFMGPGGLHRSADANSGSLRAFWFQNRIVFTPNTEVDKLWDTVRANQMTLTAIVDEPGLKIEDYTAAAAEVTKRFYEIKNWGKGWQQSAAMDYLTGKEDAVKSAVTKAGAAPKDPAKDNARVEAWVPAWVQGHLEELPPLGVRPPGDDKIAGPVQPYNVGYGASSMVPLAMYFGPSERLDKMCFAIGKGSMLTNGNVYGNGMPYIKAFSNAYNMQIGSIYFGIYGGKKLKDDWMTMFYRDVTKSPGVVAIYGHGERCYSSDVRNGEASDLLYQGISDEWLRCIELTQNEDLWLHPSVFSRYTDAIDVTADLQHRNLDPAKHGSNPRGNFFRTQSHDHRWEGWDAVPYMAILENPNDPVPPGMTEAIYSARHEALSPINWSRLMTIFQPTIAVAKARQTFTPPVAPALPAGVAAKPAGAGMVVTWQKVAGDVAGYRVYRSNAEGQALTLLNSPYTPAARTKLIAETTYTDPQGKAGQFYFVTAVDSKGIESRWFADEPALVGAKGK